MLIPTCNDVILVKLPVIVLFLSYRWEYDKLDNHRVLPVTDYSNWFKTSAHEVHQPRRALLWELEILYEVSKPDDVRCMEEAGLQQERCQHAEKGREWERPLYILWELEYSQPWEQFHPSSSLRVNKFSLCFKLVWVEFLLLALVLWVYEESILVCGTFVGTFHSPWATVVLCHQKNLENSPLIGLTFPQRVKTPPFILQEASGFFWKPVMVWGEAK